MKEKFVEPEVEVVRFTAKDVVMCDSDDTGWILGSTNPGVSDK